MTEQQIKAILIGIITDNQLARDILQDKTKQHHEHVIDRIRCLYNRIEKEGITNEMSTLR